MRAQWPSRNSFLMGLWGERSQPACLDISASPRLRGENLLNPSSECPRRRRRVGNVRAEGPGFDARGEMATEAGVVITDSLQRRLDRFRHGPSGPLAGGGRLAITAAESDRRRE